MQLVLCFLFFVFATAFYCISLLLQLEFIITITYGINYLHNKSNPSVILMHIIVDWILWLTKKYCYLDM